MPEILRKGFEKYLLVNLRISNDDISPISEIDLNLKIEEISSFDILELSCKNFSKPFLSISGNKKICLEISNRWNKNF